MLNRRGFFLGLLACPACAAMARAAEGPHWEYEGHGGAEKWGDLDDSYKACAVGAEQSPIDLSGAIKATIDPLDLDWKPQPTRSSTMATPSRRRPSPAAR